VYCSSLNAGVVVLVGDAAHSMLPNVGQVKQRERDREGERERERDRHMTMEK
jgi:hypothetical protein